MKKSLICPRAAFAFITAVASAQAMQVYPMPSYPYGQPHMQQPYGGQMMPQPHPYGGQMPQHPHGQQGMQQPSYAQPGMQQNPEMLQQRMMFFNNNPHMANEQSWAAYWRTYQEQKALFFNNNLQANAQTWEMHWNNFKASHGVR